MADLALTARDGDREAVDDALAGVCAGLPSGMPALVAETVRYCLAGGGKRLRAILLMSAYRAAGGASDASVLAAAVEVVHAYSLVHDDLPCMDDDDVRRGRPTAHRAFGVAAATAAGVAMVPIAVATAYRGARALGVPPPAAADLAALLMRAAGAGGMIGGQLLDLEAERRTLTVAELEQVHRLKTGALITAAAVLGARAAAAPRQVVRALERYGTALGLAFQIVDDVLDVTATTGELGKTAGRDQALGKSTYPLLLGLDGARERAASLAAEAVQALRTAGVAAGSLEGIARYAIVRRS